MLINSPLTARGRYLREYIEFKLQERCGILMSAARFVIINRPIEGYYFEFGCHGGNTMAIAWDVFGQLTDFQFVAFDSFEGFPEIQHIDKQEIWKKGKCATSEAEFIRLVTRHGMPGHRLTTIKGFYENSLTNDLRASLLPHKAAIIYVDCDLYESTRAVLDWIPSFIQHGTIIIFDDWFCFHGDPQKGEQRAFREFCDKNPTLEPVEFFATGEAKSFILLSRD